MAKKIEVTGTPNRRIDVEGKPNRKIIVQPRFENGFYLFYGGYMSNFARSPFTIDGIEYWCVEQWMMAEKAREFGDTEMLAKILAEKSDPWKIKLEYGRKVANFDEARWKEVARDRVFVGALEKFNQNPDLRDALLATGFNTLVEASPTDCIWGIGVGLDDPNVADASTWRGTNWLGLVLMKVRETLQRQDKVGKMMPVTVTLPIFEEIIKKLKDKSEH